MILSSKKHILKGYGRKITVRLTVEVEGRERGKGFDKGLARHLRRELRYHSEIGSRGIFYGLANNLKKEVLDGR